MILKKNIVFLVLLLFIVYYISKKNLENFSSKKVWSCFDGLNGYCYNIDRSNFNKSDWKAPEWNNTFDKKGKAITIYPNPAFKYPECENWLSNPKANPVSKECIEKISKDFREDIENEEGIKRSIRIPERSDGFKYYCANKKNNKSNCDRFNFKNKGKKYIGFGNDETKSEEERKKRFFKLL